MVALGSYTCMIHSESIQICAASMWIMFSRWLETMHFEVHAWNHQLLQVGIQANSCSNGMAFPFAEETASISARLPRPIEDSLPILSSVTFLRDHWLPETKLVRHSRLQQMEKQERLTWQSPQIIRYTAEACKCQLFFLYLKDRAVCKSLASSIQTNFQMVLCR